MKKNKILNYTEFKIVNANYILQEHIKNAYFHTVIQNKILELYIEYLRIIGVNKDFIRFCIALLPKIDNGCHPDKRKITFCEDTNTRINEIIDIEFIKYHIC